MMVVKPYLSDEQIANLRALADYLDDNAEKIVHFEQFDMRNWRARGDTVNVFPRLVDGEVVDELSLGCGTSACAAGWAVQVPGLEPVASDFYLLDEQLPRHRGVIWMSFANYQDRVFGLLGFERAYAFGSDQQPKDDPLAAAQRLRELADWHESGWRTHAARYDQPERETTGDFHVSRRLVDNEVAA